MKKTKVFASFLAASLAAFSLSFASPANAAPSQPSNEKTYRVKINTFDAENKQLANATFNIQSASGEVVDTFTSDNNAYYAELPEGTYTLVETQAPAGYKTAEPKTFTVEKPAAWTDPTIGDVYKATTASSVHVKGYNQRSYFYTVTQNVTEGQAANEVVYCVNFNKYSPAAYANYIKKDGSGDTLAAAASTSRVHNPEQLRSKLMSVIYNGYPTDASKFRGNLNDQQFRSVTQLAVWDTVDQKNRSYVLENKEMKNVYNKLMQYTQNVPENLEAHMYQIRNDQSNYYQSLMGTEFGEIAAPMEIAVQHERITKTDVVFSKTGVNGSEELPGASLEIRNEQGEVLESWVSTETAHVFALTPGTYSMHESQAPEGYDVAEDITFRVTDDFQVEVKNGEEWTVAENNTVQMKDYLTPTPKGVESPTPTSTSEQSEKPNLPNTGTDKDSLANTGAKLALPILFMLVGLGAGTMLYRRKYSS